RVEVAAVRCRDGVYITVVAEKSQVVRRPPGEIELDSLGVLVAGRRRNGRAVGEDLGRADAGAIDVISAEGELEPLLEKSAFETVIPAARGFTRVQARAGALRVGGK